MIQIIRMLFSRVGILFITVAFELLFIISMFIFFLNQAAWIDLVLRVLSVILILNIVRSSRHLSSDLMWIILILISPIAGTIIYLLLGANLLSSKTFRSLTKETADAKKYYKQDNTVLEEIKAKDPDKYTQFSYLSNQGFPVYRNREFQYYELGEVGYPHMLEELRKAKEYIFLEYFIIEEGEMWNGIHEILKEKAKQGVLVRVMYDDMGSIGTISGNYWKKLEKEGIHAISFNRVSPIINIIMNHRDHRKIMVIDGLVAFSGGVNLADEYINTFEKHGHWKDNITMVKGEAVDTYIKLFLTNWNALRHEDTDYTVYLRPHTETREDGYVVPYGETPLDDENTGQNVYMNILNQARDYVYIMTPYLIIDSDMINCLILAAERGVDVRIITPGIPDKAIVYGVTRSYYNQLIQKGVKIYEYTPGFDHGKVFISDDLLATVGTLNLDYRSLYLHFENGALFYNTDQTIKIRDDMLDTIQKSHEVKLENNKHLLIVELFWSAIRIFAGLL